ncbi:MAG TPA: TonB-dependent receptor [Thermoanaerobaculia bacterium]|jgi:vitamin B12 transporter|nr:TonB-dependent receptor [Thermoanaerobaculia bacterium]
MTTAVLLILLGALSRLVPHPPNFVAMGAIGLYAGARLPRRWAWAVPLAAMALSDLVIDWGTGRRAITLVRLAVYGSFALMVLAGRRLATEARAGRLAVFASGGALFFFLTTNFAVWASLGTYPPTLAGLALCYAAAIPWFWSTLAAELAGTAALFGLDALARREAARHAVRGAAAALLVSLTPGAAPARAQVTPTVSESVVVTATAAPEEIDDVGSAVTVVTREEIERNGWRTVQDALRSVPGASVAQSGGPGSQTSVFLRGSNSTHTLVLVDGVRVNSPFFPGYDFSLLSTENVERIEVVRGPFSALYGSESIGGVVQIFTRPAGGKLSGRVVGEAGNAGERELSAFATAGSGSFGIAASARDRKEDGDRDNDDWRERSGSLRLEGRFGDARVALEGSIADGDLGLPGPVGAETPDNRYSPREERITLPATFRPAAGHSASVTLGWARSRPSFDSRFFQSQTDAQTLEARAADTFTAGIQRVTAFGEWQRWKVDDSSNFGVNLDGEHATIWSLGAEDTLELPRGWIVTAGLRYDDHSRFGDVWSPRGTVAWRTGHWKLRASGGTGFRAPSVGELFYPFSGNPELAPERSTSWDAGADYELAGGRASASLFWNEYRDLIVYDFAANLNFNVGRARSRGVELSWRQAFSTAVAVDAGYTYLDAEDRDTGLELLRRPRHSGFLGATVIPVAGLEISPRAVFVGRRADVRALSTTERIEAPSYIRFDLYARYRVGSFGPFVRAQNLTDRGYAEVEGFPAPGRRIAGGLEVTF